jgi:hypothetical protein
LIKPIKAAASERSSQHRGRLPEERRTHVVDGRAEIGVAEDVEKIRSRERRGEPIRSQTGDSLSIATTGSSLTFLADSNITDNTQSLGNVTGTLYFPNGTRYRIDGPNGEFVSKITDRNGNQSLFWCIGIFPVKSPKPEKHAGVFSSL